MLCLIGKILKKFEEEIKLKPLSMHDPVEKLMKKNVIIYKTSDPLINLIKNMNENYSPYKTEIWASAVENENDNIVGGLDLSNYISTRLEDTQRYESKKIEDIMIKEILIISPNTSIIDARNLIFETAMKTHCQRALIVEDNKLLGTVSLTDLSDVLGKSSALSPKQQDAVNRGDY